MADIKSVNNLSRTYTAYAHIITIMRCLTCQIKSKSMRTCAGCNTARYCSKVCQKAHWKHHKAVCEKAKEAKARASEQPMAYASSLSLSKVRSRIDDLLHCQDFLNALDIVWQDIIIKSKLCPAEYILCIEFTSDVPRLKDLQKDRQSGLRRFLGEIMIAAELFNLAYYAAAVICCEGDAAVICCEGATVPTGSDVLRIRAYPKTHDLVQVFTAHVVAEEKDGFQCVALQAQSSNGRTTCGYAAVRAQMGCFT